MLFSRIVFLALVSSAFSAVASPSLSLIVTGPTRVDAVEDLRFITTLANSGDKTLKILKDPRSILSEHPTNKFSIINIEGFRPSFNGIKVKYVPDIAAKAGAYVTLTPGQAIEVAHELTNAYNFSSSGSGTYEFEADNTFYVVNEDCSISTLYAANNIAHRAHVSGKLVASHFPDRLGMSKRPSFVGCTPSQQSSIKSAAAAAGVYATNAHSYFSGTGVGSVRYATWFGTYLASRRNVVSSHFAAMNSNNFSTFTYDCSCTDSGTYAYVYPSKFGYVYFCGAFWNAPTTGTDSKAGTIIHESSHFTSNGGTDDLAYGQTSARNLAITNPSNAILNADSHEYFAENNPVLS